MEVVLFGKNGMLGRACAEMLEAQRVPYSAFGHDEVDITRSKEVLECLTVHTPRVVINCTAYTAVDSAEADPESAFLVNAAAVSQLAEGCRDVGATLIHFSTDYVFRGDAWEGYPEDAPTDPLNVYGASKAAGEEGIMAQYAQYYIIRTSWLFGPYGKNFVATMRELSESRDALSVVGDQCASPTYTYDLCEALQRYFVRPIFAGAPLPYGVYHLTNSGSCSRFELVQYIVNYIGAETVLTEVNSDAFPLPAVRPACSILQNTKTPQLRSWQEAVAEYLGSFER